MTAVDTPAPGPSSATARAEQLFSLFLATDAEGAPLYTDDDLLGFVLVLLKTFPPASPSAATVAVLEHVGRMIGVERTTARDELGKKLDAHFAAHPVPPLLLAAFRRFFQEERAQGGDGAQVAAAFLGFLGDERKLQALSHVRDVDANGRKSGPKNGPMLALLAHKQKPKKATP